MVKLPNRLTKVAVKVKRSMIRLGANFVKKIPSVFRKGNVALTYYEANKFLSEIYPDSGSSCWCNNRVGDKPQYDLHIILPAYNVERYIIECLDSIINQETSFSYFITIVNDGSTDNTCKLLCKYKNLGNIEIISQDNTGYSGSRNTALANIKGRYLMFVDSDDKLAQDAIDTLLKLGIESNADIVQGSFTHFDNKGIFDKKILNDKSSYVAGDVEILSYPWAKIYKSYLFEHLCFPLGYWYEDSITKFILVSNSKLKISSSKIVYHYRHHSDTVMRQNKNPLKSIDALYVTKQLLKDCHVHYEINEFIFNHFLHQAKWNFDRIKVLKNKEILKSAFVIHKELYDLYFKSYGYKSKKFPIMQMAFEEGDYGLYRIACKFYV